MFVEIFIFAFTFITSYLIISVYERIKYFKSFEKRNIPGPKPNFILGNLLDLRSYKNRNELLEFWTKKYGKVYGFYYGKRRYLNVADLDLMQKVLITENRFFFNRDDLALDIKFLKDSLVGTREERWHNLRKNISPTFSHSRISSGKFDVDINSCISNLNKEINEKLKSNNEMNMYDLCQSFTLDVISRTAFGLEENVYEENNILKKAISEFFQLIRSDFMELVLLIPILRKICEFIFNKSTGGKLIDLIHKRMKNHIKTFLKDLHKKDKNDNESKEQNKNMNLNENLNKNDKPYEKATVLLSLTKKLGKNLLTEDEFIGNVILILIAGFETTANSITTAFYALAKYPNIQNTLRESILRDGLKSEYLDMFWHENLRIFPPVTLFQSRRVSQNCEFNGVKFLEDDVVFIPTWLINRDPEIWPEPEKFDPLRFSPENKKKFHPCQFTTFGHGPRICLGLSFANYEAKSVIASIIKNFKIESCSSTPDPIEFVTPSVLNNPSKPVVLKITKINQFF